MYFDINSLGKTVCIDLDLCEIHYCSTLPYIVVKHFVLIAAVRLICVCICEAERFRGSGDHTEICDRESGSLGL